MKTLLPDADEKFSNLLKKERPLKGIEDLVSRLPSLVSQRMSNCGRICLEGFAHYEDTKENMKNEVSEAIRYSGFKFFWGKKGKNITIRMQMPIGTRALNEYERKTFEQLIKCFYQDSQQKFKKSVLKINDKGDTIIETALLSERVSGKIKNYWGPFYDNIMRPLLAYIRIFNRDFLTN